MDHKDSKRWIDVLPDLVKNYNETEHSTIDMKPADMTRKKEEKFIDKQLEASKAIVESYQKIEKGDQVRLPRKKSTFQKAGKNYSDKVYTVNSVDTSKITVEGLKTKYKRDEVLVVPEGTKDIGQERQDKAVKKNRIQRRLRKEGLN